MFDSDIAALKAIFQKKNHALKQILGYNKKIEKELNEEQKETKEKPAEKRTIVCSDINALITPDPRLPEEAKHTQGNTLLTVAVMTDNQQAVIDLLNAGAQINVAEQKDNPAAIAVEGYQANPDFLRNIMAAMKKANRFDVIKCIIEQAIILGKIDLLTELATNYSEEFKACENSLTLAVVHEQPGVIKFLFDKTNENRVFKDPSQMQKCKQPLLLHAGTGSFSQLYILNVVLLVGDKILVEAVAANLVQQGAYQQIIEPNSTGFYALECAAKADADNKDNTYAICQVLLNTCASHTQIKLFREKAKKSGTKRFQINWKKFLKVMKNKLIFLILS